MYKRKVKGNICMKEHGHPSILSLLMKCVAPREGVTELTRQGEVA